MYVSIKVTSETKQLINKARVKFAKQHPNHRPTYDNVLNKAIRGYLKK